MISGRIYQKLMIQFAHEMGLNRSTSIQGGWNTYLSFNSILGILNIPVLFIKLIMLKGNMHLKILFTLKITKKKNTARKKDLKR